MLLKTNTFFLIFAVLSRQFLNPLLTFYQLFFANSFDKIIAKVRLIFILVYLKIFLQVSEVT